MKKTLIAGAVAAAMMMVPSAAFAGGNRNNTDSLTSSNQTGLCKIVPQWHWFDWIPCHN
jgi:hypothetical protein